MRWYVRRQTREMPSRRTKSGCSTVTLEGWHRTMAKRSAGSAKPPTRELSRPRVISGCSTKTDGVWRRTTARRCAGSVRSRIRAMPSPRTRLGYCTTTAGVWRGTMARRCVGSAWPRTTVTPAPRTISVGCTLMEKAFRAIWPKRVRRRLVMAMNCQKMACRKLGDRTTGSPAPRPWRPATRRRKHRLRRRGQGSLTARPNARGRAPSRVRVGRDRMNEGPAVFVRCLEGSAECGERAAKRLRYLVFEMEIAAPDQRHVGFDPAEGVGFVHKAGGQNARHDSSPQL